MSGDVVILGLAPHFLCSSRKLAATYEALENLAFYLDREGSILFFDACLPFLPAGAEVVLILDRLLHKRSAHTHTSCCFQFFFRLLGPRVRI
jgi:hypothetical protein